MDREGLQGKNESMKNKILNPRIAELLWLDFFTTENVYIHNTQFLLFVFLCVVCVF